MRYKTSFIKETGTNLCDLSGREDSMEEGHLVQRNAGGGGNC